jgi:hypothetical protein
MARKSMELGRACWVLGAGASFDCFGGEPTGVPLTRDLMDVRDVDEALVQYIESLIASGALACSSVSEALGAKLEGTVDCVRGLADTSDLATRVAAQKSLSVLLWEITRSISFYQAAAIFSGQLEAHGLPKNYGELVVLLSLTPKSSVITLNYDTFLDGTFVSASKVPRVPKSEQWQSWLALLDSVLGGVAPNVASDKGVFVKLHGSLYLYNCLESECAKYRQPFESGRKWLEGRHSHELSRHVTCPACGELATSLILPPGRNKSPAESRFLEATNAVAEAALSRADAWVILGYSCPEYDVDMADLFARAASRSPESGEPRDVLIVAPDASEIAARMHKLLGQRLGSEEWLRVHPARETFTSFLNKIRPDLQRSYTRMARE